MFVIDASVWVNSFDQQEPGYEISRQFLAAVGQQPVTIAVPSLLLAEVAGAISRTRQAPTQAHSFATALSKLPNVTLVSLDIPLAELSLQLAAQHGLRGADATYASVTLRTGYTLVSLDNEHLTRLKNVIEVKTPAEALSSLTAADTDQT